MAAAKGRHSRRAQAKRLRARRRGQSKRTQRAGRLTVVLGLGIAVATGHGVAAAGTDDGQSAGPSADSDTTSNPTESAENISGTTPSKTETETMTAPTTSGDAPTTSTRSSGGALTSSEYEEDSDDESGQPDEKTSTDEILESPTEPEAVVSDPGAAPTETAESTAGEEVSVDAVAATVTEEPAEAVVALSAPVEESATVALTDEEPPVGARTMAATTATAGLPTVSLPPYPTVPGATPTQVAVAVVVVLFRALQGAMAGPVPNPIAIPLYLILVAAYQRLTEIALNHVPVANPSTPLVVPITNTVTGFLNASDPDGDPLSWSVTGAPAKGTVLLDPLLGSYVYTPTPSFIRDGGTDTFTVTIDDSAGAAEHFYAPNGHTTTQDITITLPGTGINLPPLPTFTHDSDSIGVVRGRIQPNDLDDETHTYSLANANNSAGATANSAYSELGGIVSLDTATGQYTYVPAVSGNLLGIPTHTDSFWVTVDDGHGGMVDKKVSFGADLTLSVVNTSTDSATGAYSGGLNVPPADIGLLTYSHGAIAPTKGTVEIDGSGNFVYTPTAAARHAAAADDASNAAKTDTFSVYGTDANGRTITVATVEVTISPTNESPSATYTLDPVDSNGVVTGTISVTDGDPTDDHTFGPATILTGKGTVTVDTDTGVFTFTPTDAARHAASALGAPLSDTQVTFAIDVSDEHGGVTSVSVTAPIAPKNSPPTVNFGTPLKLLGIATYTPQLLGGGDADGDALTFTVTTPPTKGTVLINLGLGNVISTIVYTANNALFPQSDSFVVTVSDGHGGTQVATLNPY